MEVTIQHKADKHLFYANIDGKEAFLQYRPLNETIWEYQHTFVPTALRGQGIGNALVKFALDYARQHQLRVKPTCPKVQSYVATHHEYDDLLEFVA